MNHKEHQELHDALRDDLFKRQLSNSETLDKAILSLSSAGIGVSLLFLKTKGSQEMTQVADVYFLHWSWGGFLFAIVWTLVSFYNLIRWKPSSRHLTQLKTCNALSSSFARQLLLTR